jgi:hypothetical protein
LWFFSIPPLWHIDAVRYSEGFTPLSIPARQEGAVHPISFFVTLTGSRGGRLLYFAGTVKLLLSPGKAGGNPKKIVFPTFFYRHVK